MTPKQIKNTILEKLQGSLASFNSAWVYKTNVDSSGQNRVFDHASTEEWVRPVIKFADTMEGEKGDRGLGVRNGLLMFSIFVPENTGINTCASYASMAEYLFGARTLDIGKGRVVLRQPSTQIIGADGYGKFEIRVDIGFNTFTEGGE